MTVDLLIAAQKIVLGLILFGYGGGIPCSFANIVDIIPSKDTYLIEGSPEQTHGSSSWIDVGHYLNPGYSPPDYGGNVGSTRALMHFSVSDAVPAGSDILGGNLTFAVYYSAPGAMVDDMFALHQLTTDWSEGNSGEEGASWKYSVKPTLWNNAGGGGDFDESPIATFNLPIKNPGSWESPGITSIPISAGTLQSYLDSPSKNKGFIIIGNEAKAFNTYREFWDKDWAPENSGGAGIPPALQLEFEPPPPNSKYYDYTIENQMHKGWCISVLGGSAKADAELGMKPCNKTDHLQLFSRIEPGITVIETRADPTKCLDVGPDYRFRSRKKLRLRNCTSITGGRLPTQWTFNQRQTGHWSPLGHDRPKYSDGARAVAWCVTSQGVEVDLDARVIIMDCDAGARHNKARYMWQYVAAWT